MLRKECNIGKGPIMTALVKFETHGKGACQIREKYIQPVASAPERAYVNIMNIFTKHKLRYDPITNKIVNK